MIGIHFRIFKLTCCILFLFANSSFSLVFGQYTCDCPNENAKVYKDKRFNAVPFERLFEYENFLIENDFKSYGEFDFANLFAADLTSSPGGWYDRTSFFQFDAMDFKTPIRFQSSDSLIIFNLTPCKTNDRMYSVPMSVLVKYPIREIDEGFDRTAMSYFNLMFEIISFERYNEIINAFLKSKFEHHPLDSLNLFIAELNDSNGLGLTLIDPDIDGDHYIEYGSNEWYIDEFLNELGTIQENEEFDFFDYLFNKFIHVSTIDTLEATHEELANINLFFEPFLYVKGMSDAGIDVFSLESYLVKHYSASFSVTEMTCTLPSSILHFYDVNRKVPSVDSLSEQKKSEMFICFQNFWSLNLNSNWNDVSNKFQSMQLHLSTIANTNCLVSANGSPGTIYLNRNSSLKKEVERTKLLDKIDMLNSNYLRFIRSEFTGIEVNEVEIRIPQKNKYQLFKATDFWVSNSFVTFSITSPTNESNKMLKQLSQLGFSRVETKDEDGRTKFVILIKID